MVKVNIDNLTKLVKEFPKFYSVNDVLSTYNFLLDAKDIGQQYLMSCPFHLDKTPSFYILKKEGVFNCFSCNRHGSLLKFYYLLSNSNLSFSLFAENLLQENTLLKEYLGFNTIFTTNFIGDGNTFRKRKPLKIDKERDIPLSVLVTFLKKFGYDYETMATSVLMLQQGASYREIQTFYKNLETICN